ncbi:BQ2448_2387 [Microbotryum intermedium]|uniref:BQ2448_2387 protein n=1 Tax=Microbotryum intermedium TaxID=269621 RepID=A0A238F897_9BASI|nr:BQ2448_2387 [Microbotryum intermedium]
MGRLFGRSLPSLPTARRMDQRPYDGRGMTSSKAVQEKESGQMRTPVSSSVDKDASLASLSGSSVEDVRTRAPPAATASSQGTRPRSGIFGRRASGRSEVISSEDDEDGEDNARSIAVTMDPAEPDLDRRGAPRRSDGNDQDDDDDDEEREDPDPDPRRRGRTRWRRKFHALTHKLHDKFIKDERIGAITTIDAEGNVVKKIQHRYLPILSGLLCPFSVLLDIPGLTERWYVRTSGFNVVETQPNPAILDVGQAISMALGVTANLALISRFLERKPYLCTWVAIVALTAHDVINICIVVIFGVVHRFADGFTYGVAYWMTVAATVASLSCNITLVLDLVHTRDFKASGSGLTEKQRALVIAVMSLLCYIGLGSLVFSFLEDFSYIDSLYFTIVTITSVGFGDLVPTTVAAKIFSFFYDLCGLVLLAFTIAIARETVLETFEANYRARRDMLAKKARERKEDKRRRTRERRMRLERQLRERLEESPMNAIDGGVGLSPVMITAAAMGGGRGGRALSRFGTSMEPAAGPTIHGVASEEDRAAQRALDFVHERESGLSLWKASSRWIKRRLGIMEAYTPHCEDLDHQGDADAGNSETAVGSSEPTFEHEMTRTLTSESTVSRVHDERLKSLKEQLQHEQEVELRTKLTLALSLFVVFWLVGAAVFHLTEQWSYFNSMWFCFIFFTTIGYGDFSPQSNAGRAFFIAWALFGIANMTLTLSVVTEAWSSRYKTSIIDGKRRRVLGRLRNKNTSADTSALRLLALDGFHHEDEIEAKDLPTKLMEAIRGFQDHARYFMLGRMGDVPENLRQLFDAAGLFDHELEAMIQDGHIDGGQSGDTKHFLFMVSYERQFDVLMDAAERLSQVFKSHEDELVTMRELNNKLRVALAKAETGEGVDVGEQALDGLGAVGTVEGHEEGEPKAEGLFHRRPPGGYGDEHAEFELEQSLDVDDDDDDGLDIGYKRKGPAPSPVPTPTPTIAPTDAEEALRRSSAMLEQVSNAPEGRPKLRLRTPSQSGAWPSNLGSPAVSPTNLRAPPLGHRSALRSPGATSWSGNTFGRTPTLTFAEPERPSTPSRALSSSNLGSSITLRRFATAPPGE